MIEKIQETVEYIKQTLPEIPDIALILGSGLGEYADSFSDPVILPYSEIPHFPTSTVAGHKGQLVFQKFPGCSVVAMQGRFHYYEGYDMEQVTFPVRVFGMLGIERLLITNAAGGANPDFDAGDLMLITDHINLMGGNPLRGKHSQEFGERFPDMSNVYNAEDSAAIESVAQELKIPLKKGVYIAMSGPSYETPAEIRMAQILHGDAVGMSTVPEAIVATQMGMRVSGISCITNMAAGITGAKLTHEEVMETADRVRKQFMTLVNEVIHAFGK